jgi:PAS domain S-box-containing protein
MNNDPIVEHTDLLQLEAHLLSSRVHQLSTLRHRLPGTDSAGLLPIIEEFAAAVEELRAAEEELRQQSIQLSTAQGALEEERRRYQELFDFAPDAYFLTDAKGVIREANHAVSSLVGFARRYVVGKPLAAFVAPGEQPDFQTRLARLRSAGGSGVQEWEQRLRPRRRQQELVAAIRAAPIRDAGGRLTGIRWMLRDVTEHRQTEDELRRASAELERRVRERTAQLESANRVNAAWLAQELAASAAAIERYERLLLRAHEAVFQATPDGRLLSVNPAAARLLGYDSPEELIEADSSGRSPVVDSSQRRALLQRLMEAGELNDVEVELHTQDGGRRRLALRAWAVRDAEGALRAIEGCLIDPARAAL